MIKNCFARNITWTIKKREKEQYVRYKKQNLDTVNPNFRHNQTRKSDIPDIPEQKLLFDS